MDGDNSAPQQPQPQEPRLSQPHERATAVAPPLPGQPRQGAPRLEDVAGDAAGNVPPAAGVQLQVGWRREPEPGGRCQPGPLRHASHGHGQGGRQVAGSGRFGGYSGGHNPAGYGGHNGGHYPVGYGGPNGGPNGGHNPGGYGGPNGGPNPAGYGGHNGGHYPGGYGGPNGGHNPGAYGGHNGGHNPGGYGGYRGGAHHGGARGRRPYYDHGGPQRRDQGDADHSRQRERVIGFRKLTELAEGDALATMGKLSSEGTLATFVKLTNEKQLHADWLRLIVTILARVCQVEYKNIVLVLFDRICQKEFLDQLLLHIVQLEADTDSGRRATVGAFFLDLCVMVHGVVRCIPEVACERLDNLVKKAASEAENLVPFEGADEARRKLAAVREEIAVKKTRLEAARAAREGSGAASGRSARRDDHCSAGPPPEDFRELSVFPTAEDLIPHQPYLRPIKTSGAYDDVNHYTDVQVRLLREDFMRPLREGIAEYRQKVLEMERGNNKRKHVRVNNVRAYERVQFVGVKAKDDRVCLVLCFDPEQRFAANIPWEFSKRFMNGALMVLSRDLGFDPVVLVTVAKRDLKELAEGKVMVELCEGAVRRDLFHGHFLMMESQVFFGSYGPVLKALKGMNEHTFPLREYIVSGSNEVVLPDYQQRALEAAAAATDDAGDDDGDKKWFALPLRSDSAVGTENTVDVRVEDAALEAWPRAEELGLDASQYGALCGAITNKLMLIQGPPGTGKTFLGLKIAATLLRNRELWTTADRPRPMLVVCYTNHALDQFLSGLLPATRSVVRVGSGCKDPRVEPYSIRNVQRACYARGIGSRVLAEHRAKLAQLQRVSDCLRSCITRLKDGVVDPDTLHEHGVITDAQRDFFRKQSVLRWLRLEQRARNVCRAYAAQRREWRSKFQKPLGAAAATVSETILRPGADWNVDAVDVPGAEVLPRLRCVRLALSCGALEGIVKALAEMRNDAAARASPTAPVEVNDGVVMAARADVGWLLDNVRRGLASTGAPQDFDVRAVELDEVQKLPHRWQVYRLWVNNFLETTLNVALEEFNVAYAAEGKLVQEWKMVEDQAIMASKKVIGMTTSFAASRQEILRQLKPSIVIVEEAAEVLEAHVLVSLTRHVQHLVMIGDHQQLRPSPAVFELARNFHLDVSMFERLINNGVRCEALSTQHRMRPEIARLIRPAIYPHLVDHPSVLRFPDVRGVAKNVFFVDHTQREEEVNDTQSYQNSHEARFLSALVKYLRLHGYDSSMITILSTYKGQQRLLFELARDEAHLKDVRITVVDNYQGEENDLILLSLVRSNAEDKVGFLKTENRVCVALSRARHGLFMIGNMANLTAADTVWRKVRAELEAQGSLGAALPLRCTIHGTVMDVGSAADFARCPQGGCDRLCQVTMGCGHLCEQVCHVQDRKHKNARCMQPCEKEICPQGHPCPDRCYQKCQPCKVPKMETLKCGHTISIHCYKDLQTASCYTEVSATLPACGHQRKVQCHKTATLQAVPCLEPCIIRMKCGHSCETTCHVLKDPDHETVKCMKSCGGKRLGCSMDHICRKICHEPCEECNEMLNKKLACGHTHKMMCKEDVASKLCERKCARTLPDCGHECAKLCHETCAPCRTKVEKTAPKCGHTQMMECSLSPADFVDCEAACERLLSCGHRCRERCGDRCSATLCREPVPYKWETVCGHVAKVPCCESDVPRSAALDADLLKRCQEPCGALLACDHRCQGTCGACAQGRLHAACKAKCGKPLICGHSCDQPCAKGCPPCNKPCTVQCVHSKCGARCGEVCVPCKEPCPRRCAHKRCRRPCGALCPDEPCTEPCNKKLKRCGHACVGLCGEPCICRECREDQFETFFGMEDDEGARFVMLPDCKHIFEVTGLDKWMLQNGGEGEEEITKKVCPRCTQGVTRSLRYGNVVKRNAADVAKVKRELYGDWATIEPAARAARAALQGACPLPQGMPAAMRLLTDVNLAVRKLELRFPRAKPQSGARKTSPRSLTEVKSLEQYARILRTLGRVLRNSLRPSNVADAETTTITGTTTHGLSEAGKAELLRAADGLCSGLQGRNLFRISEQEATDVNLELERLQRLSQLCQVEAALGFASLGSADKDAYRIASEAIRSVGPYPKAGDASVRASLAGLAEKVAVAVTRQEVDMVVAALGMRQGHWFKCPNGHPYVITECGGAMQEGRCNECGAAIGGANHALRSDNRQATEIDGATRPAWPTMMQHYDPAYDSE